MSRRVANIIVLTEDAEQSNLIRRYLEQAGHDTRAVKFLSINKGCASQWVRLQFPAQVAACRGTLGRRASCLLLVMTDADNLSCVDRRKTLLEELVSKNMPPLAAGRRRARRYFHAEVAGGNVDQMPFGPADG